ncbi:hypothetical protein L9F63_022537, partial [Diploptera punctata]
MHIIITGLFVHLVFLASIFDIYFKSPVVNGIAPQVRPLKAPAKRLVLLVADGLRADTFFEVDEFHRGNAPYLRSIIEKRGTWGVSHTRIPTESRPGHVALIAGLYEDPSAGWKENPVEFDSVFNESRFTWSWGSPDVLPMFAKGASGDHVYIDTYGGEVEDFSGKSSTEELDIWVFKKVESFLNLAKVDANLNEKLQQDKLVFFLHLLGIRSMRPVPVSKYKHNLKVVDSGIEKIEQLFEMFYQHDNRTAYIFTADHGMTDWGSHGAGDKSETETPLVVWGPGVPGPRPSRDCDPPSPHNWELSHKARHDVNQADIAPLMSSLIGVPVPVNSVGKLPQDYLNVSELEMSENMFANALQMAAQFSKKREITEAGTLASLYKEFPREISKSEELMSLSLLGLEYYQNYYQCLLLTCITLAILGWICWLLLSLFNDEKDDLHYVKRHWGLDHTTLFNGGYLINVTFSLLVILSAFLIFGFVAFAQHCQCIPIVVLWFSILRQNKDLYEERIKSMRLFFLLIVFYILGIETLVISFFHRYFLSIGILGLAAWPVVSPLHKPVKKHLLVAWIVSCLFLAIFPLLPVVGKEPNTNLVNIHELMMNMTMFEIAISWKHESYEDDTSFLIKLRINIAIAIWDLLSTAQSIREKKGLLWINQIISWLLLGVSLCVPMLGSQRILLRLYSVGVCLMVPFLLLSASHEVLFVVVFMFNMFCWISLELHCQDAVSIQDFRRAYFFLFYICVSFFGTGNIASINSFDPMWVRCFLTVFSPFIMTSLILWKLMIPFLGVTCIFRALNFHHQITLGKLFLIVLVFSDAMVLHFLHLVTNQGSWLDIGTSISHYVIVHIIVVFLVLLISTAQLLTRR